MPVSRLAPRALLLACAAVVLLPPSESRAQAPHASPAPVVASDPASPASANIAPKDDPSVPVQLFREGRQLLAEGHVEAACAKFRASLALRRSPGTLLNVGNCLESSGDLTGAAAAFEETLTLARADGNAQKAEAWSRAARTELDALVPRIPRLVVTAPGEADVRVELDGQTFTAFDIEQRINPGRHRLLATAPGEPGIEHRFELAEQGHLVLDLSLPAPAPQANAEAQAKSVAEPAPLDESASDAPPVLPWSILGVGGAVLVAGGIAAVIATGKASALIRECPDRMCKDDLSAPESARRTALAADVLMATGLVGVAVGATWLPWPEDDITPSLSASCTGDGCSASIRGRFF
jgi:tetratricopeptide (TPR) repeat protein